MSKLEQAFKAVDKYTSEAVHRGLSDSLHCCIDTGNEAEAKLVMQQAEESFEDGQLNIQQLGDLRSDFDTAF